MVKRTLPVRLRRWVDRDLLRSNRPVSVVLPVAPIVAGAGLFGHGSAGWWLAMAAGAIAALWWLSRILHVLRVASEVSGRTYDRKTRYILPPEYAESLSARGERKRRLRQARAIRRP